MNEKEIVQKLWGREEVLHNGDDYCCKVLRLNRGFRSSLHTHRIKRETFVVVEGEVQLELNGQKLTLVVGDSVTLEPGDWHRFSALTHSAVVVEASTRHRDDDVVRKEDSFAISREDLIADGCVWFCPRCKEYTPQFQDRLETGKVICVTCGLLFSKAEAHAAIVGRLSVGKEKYL